MMNRIECFKRKPELSAGTFENIAVDLQQFRPAHCLVQRCIAAQDFRALDLS